MAVQTNDKKLNGAGLGTVWGLVKSLVSNLSSVVETNRVNIVGDVSSVSPTATFKANSIVRVDKETFMSNASTVGVPSHVVKHNSEVVTHKGEAVTHGNNSISSWIKIAG